MKQNLRLLLAVACLALVLCACGKEETPPPENYPVTAGETLPALTQILSEQERGEVSYALLEQGEGESDPTSHKYSDLSNSGQTVQDYVAELTQKYNCQILEKEEDKYVTASQPDYTQSSGAVTVGKESQEKEGLLLLTLTWAEGTCTIERIFLPEETISFSMPVSLTEASDRVKGWLKQDGKKPEDYFVQAEEGLVRLENSVCIAVDVYAKADHALIESYLVETKSGAIYRMDRETKEAIPLA